MANDAHQQGLVYEIRVDRQRIRGTNGLTAVAFGVGRIDGLQRVRCCHNLFEQTAHCPRNRKLLHTKSRMGADLLFRIVFPARVLVGVGGQHVDALERGLHPELVAVLGGVSHLGGVEERLGGDAASVQAGATQELVLLDDGDLQA